MSKYHNKKIEYDGILFDSKKEKDRYIYLRECEENGIITDLRVHNTHVILPAIKETRKELKQLKTKVKEIIKEVTIQREVTFSPDFEYRKDGELIVEDVKGSKYAISRDFPLRAKLFRFVYKTPVKIIFDPFEMI